MNETFLAIINPAAGGGRCGERVGAALDRLRGAGIALETAQTRAAGDATRIAREAYGRGYRKFLAVGGDGTSYEIVNGLFPESWSLRSQVSGLKKFRVTEEQIPTLGFLPLGTGNSFCAISQVELPARAVWNMRCRRWRRGVRGLAMFCDWRTKTERSTSRIC